MKAAVIAPIATAVLLLAGCGSDKVVGTCGSDPNVTVEDCDRPDLGSCGNACCKVTAVIDSSAEDVAHALNKSLSNGGADGNYMLQPLAEGVLGFTQLGNLSMYLGQVHHMTSGPAHFNDTVNILVESTDDGKSTITAFSISLIAGALGDAGQGYKNIAMALKAASFGSNWDGSLKSQGGSCSAPSRQQETAEDAETAVSSRRLSPAVDGSCVHGTTDKDCQNKDLGSCGNACCSLKVTVSQSVEKTLSMLNNSFDKGGADGLYTKAMTAEGSLGFANLTGLAPPSFSAGGAFIGQVNHMTSGPAHYNDTVNFNLVEGSTSEETTITAFSISLIGGAYGDNGQGYKNIKMAMDNAFGDKAKIVPGNLAQSCPAPAALV